MKKMLLGFLLLLFLIPTVNARISNFTPIEDAYVRQTYPDTNFGSDYLFIAHDYGECIDGIETSRIYLKFDVDIPENSYILNANLSHCLTSCSVFAYGTDVWLHAFEIDEDWNESTITWNNQPYNYTEDVCKDWLAKEWDIWWEHEPELELNGTVRHGKYVSWDLTKLTQREKDINIMITSQEKGYRVNMEGCGPGYACFYCSANSKDKPSTFGDYCLGVLPTLTVEYTICGDDVCEYPETQKNCCMDCGCPLWYQSCVDNECKIGIVHFTLPLLVGVGILLWTVKAVMGSPVSAEKWIAVIISLAVAITLFGILVGVV